MAFSDERTKRVTGRSDAARDLATLAVIEVTDYTHIDTAARGAGRHKKVIAQQLEKVYPQAVQRGTDTVPDINGVRGDVQNSRLPRLQRPTDTSNRTVEIAILRRMLISASLHQQ